MAMQDPRDRADHYRREGIKCHEPAKSAELSFLGGFYRRIAVRYMPKAEEILNEARVRGGTAPQSAATSTGIAGGPE